MRERSNRAVLKTADGATRPWVRIPPPPLQPSTSARPKSPDRGPYCVPGRLAAPWGRIGRWDRGESSRRASRSAAGIAGRVRALRRAAGMTQVELADGPVHEAVREPDRARRGRALGRAARLARGAARGRADCSSRPGSAPPTSSASSADLADGRALLDDAPLRRGDRALPAAAAVTRARGAALRLSAARCEARRGR